MILIVDDHIDTSTALVRLLSKCGQQAVAVASGEAALALLETCTPSLIVLDMMMPGMHGLEVLRHVRSKPALTDIPVVVFSADYNLDTARKAREQGAQEYIVKGTVGWDHLCDLILKYIAA